MIIILIMMRLIRFVEESSFFDHFHAPPITVQELESRQNTHTHSVCVCVCVCAQSRRMIGMPKYARARFARSLCRT